jgi:hypothetical protein
VRPDATATTGAPSRTRPPNGVDLSDEVRKHLAGRNHPGGAERLSRVAEFSSEWRTDLPEIGADRACRLSEPKALASRATYCLLRPLAAQEAYSGIVSKITRPGGRMAQDGRSRTKMAIFGWKDDGSSNDPA